LPDISVRSGSTKHAGSSATDVRRTLDAVWRSQSSRIIGAAARIVRDVGLGDDLAHDAVVSALEHWPVGGIPDDPAAWLMKAAANRAIDRLRSDSLRLRKQQELTADSAEGASRVAPVPLEEETLDDHLGDDLLRLMFVAAHPVLSRNNQVALSLRLLGGLTTAEIASAFLVPEPTIAQRIVRAKRTLAAANVPFEVPSGGEMKSRLPAVLEVIYLIFNEGYAATTGSDWMRPQLCEMALRLGHVLMKVAAQEPEVYGLVSLMEIQSSRRGARDDAQGKPIPLLAQDRRHWDRSSIDRGLAALDRAAAISHEPGSYELQAAIAACHARAATPDQTDWLQIVALYEALALKAPSPIVELNRAVAIGMARGPEIALALVDRLLSENALNGYYPLSAVRGDLLARLGRLGEARQEFERAATLTHNAGIRSWLLDRARAMWD